MVLLIEERKGQVLETKALIRNERKRFYEMIPLVLDLESLQFASSEEYR